MPQRYPYEDDSPSRKVPRPNISHAAFVLGLLASFLAVLGLFATLLNTTTRRDTVMDMLLEDVSELHATIRDQENNLSQLNQRLSAQEREIAVLKEQLRRQ